MTGDSAEAQDLTQEAFLQLYRKLGTFRGESSFYTWFHRLVVNVVRAQLRRKRRLMELIDTGKKLHRAQDRDNQEPGLVWARGQLWWDN
jgi:RNA polymerase sigma factor (sigma-70 family)